jgi:thiol-disulfide isomerase/thioredoxin
MNKFLGLLFLALAFFAVPVFAQDGHEYAPLEEKVVNYENWRLKDLQDKPIDLRSFVQGKKLVLVVYFAPWCPNWRNEAPIAAKLYDKYKAQGLEVIGVGEYASRDEVRTFFGSSGARYTIVTESESREARDKTTHYAYRQATGDKRKWGSPWNIFLDPASISRDEEVLTEKAWVVNGELIEADVDKFIADRLKTTAAAITPCKN